MTLTVIIRDEYPLSIQEPCTYRTVHIEMTEDQIARLKLWNADEVIGSVFLEPDAKP